MNTFVTQVTSTPGHAMGSAWATWLVISTTATLQQVTSAIQTDNLEYLIYANHGKAAPVAQAALAAAGITATVLAADYLFSIR